MITLHQINTWDNDQELAPDFYDPDNKIYYMNDWADPSRDAEYLAWRLELGDVKVISTRKVHNDDKILILSRFGVTADDITIERF